MFAHCQTFFTPYCIWRKGFFLLKESNNQLLAIPAADKGATPTSEAYVWMGSIFTVGSALLFVVDT